MLNHCKYTSIQRGSTLIEILVTIVILAFGLLGLAGMQARVQTNELESYQRAQALVLLNDMVERIRTNRPTANSYNLKPTDQDPTVDPAVTIRSVCSAAATANVDGYNRCEWSKLLNNEASAASYSSATSFGTGSATATCSLPTTPNVADLVTYDQCEWSKMLKGTSMVQGTTNIGAMEGARGCITQLQAANPQVGVCAPAIYQVAVAWQGQSATVAPVVSCGTGLYGSDDALRRLISTQVSVPLLGCT